MIKKIVLFSFTLLVSQGLAFAQSVGRVDDQNPNAYKSAARYKEAGESLLLNQGSTVQQTYKAYDWYQAKQERIAQRRAARQSNPYYYNDWYYPSIYTSLGFGYYGGRHHGWGWSPYVGIGMGRYW